MMRHVVYRGAILAPTGDTHRLRQWSEELLSKRFYDRHRNAIPHCLVCLVVRTRQFEGIRKAHQPCGLSGRKQTGANDLPINYDNGLAARATARRSETACETVKPHFRSLLIFPDAFVQKAHTALASRRSLINLG